MIWPDVGKQAAINSVATLRFCFMVGVSQSGRSSRKFQQSECCISNPDLPPMETLTLGLFPADFNITTSRLTGIAVLTQPVNLHLLSVPPASGNHPIF